jgi:N-methylhydantoinase A
VYGYEEPWLIMSSLRVGIDVGGTFTDFVFLRNEQEVINLKVPSTPSDPAAAILDGLRQVLGEGDEVGHFAQGTTLAVNTLVQRNGARTGLLVTRGFRDLLEIGRQRLLDPNNYAFAKAPTLVARRDVREVPERLDAAGNVVEPLDEAVLIERVASLVEDGVAALAICFMHAYRSDRHERAAAAAIRARFPDLYICTSSEIWPEQREYERALVTVINAYVGPRMDQYFNQLERYAASLSITTPVLSTRSNGGVMATSAAKTVPVATLLSGPASGVMGANHVGQLTGITRLIGLDMGGTTAEVAIIDGEVLYSTESTIGDFPLVTPAVDVSSIGAGGGSVAWVDDFGVLKVGPRSAGSMPGPACYGRGGTEATITDAYLVAGILRAGTFTGGLTLNRELAEAALSVIGERLGLSLPETASAILQVATANMYAQLMLLLARKGVDHQDFALLAYGGAGPTHALLLAREAGIKKVLVPPSPGTVCALGALVADIKSDFIETVYRNTAEFSADALEAAFGALEQKGRAWLNEQAVAVGEVRSVRSADMRYKGQSFNLTVQLPERVEGDLNGVRDAFHDAYSRIYGYADRAAPVELINLRFTIIGTLPTPDIRPLLREGAPAAPTGHRMVTISGVTKEAAVYTGPDLIAGQRLSGPSIVEAMGTTILIPGGYAGEVLSNGAMLIEEISQ